MKINHYYYETMMFSAVYSYAKSVAADSWLALMDRLLILGEDCIEEKNHVKANILQLIDMYYDALDAPKKGGQKVSSVSFF
jgi:RNA-dependent RNA polymerase